MHEATLYVSIEQIRHGLDSTMSESTQIRHAPFAVWIHGFVLLFFWTVIQQIHE